MALIQEIEAFLASSGMSATAFGTKVLNDPPFVQQLRAGRDPKMSTADRVRQFIADFVPDAEPASEAAE
jgi:aspartate carbamoyltransferase catalytic subunit